MHFINHFWTYEALLDHRLQIYSWSCWFPSCGRSFGWENMRFTRNIQRWYGCFFCEAGLYWSRYRKSMKKHLSITIIQCLYVDTIYIWYMYTWYIHDTHPSPWSAAAKSQRCRPHHQMVPLGPMGVAALRGTLRWREMRRRCQPVVNGFKKVDIPSVRPCNMYLDALMECRPVDEGLGV